MNYKFVTIRRIICFVFFDLATNIGLLRDGGDSYNEELFIKRLKSENILSQFRFIITTRINLGTDYQVFPRIIGEVLTKYNIDELHFSLTQGVWKTDKWGIAPQPASPSGAQLYAWFSGIDGESSVDERWNYLLNSLNGIFCASLLEMNPTLTVIPKRSFRLRNSLKHKSNHSIRYGALSGETVCTENLTPWRKLLPCKQTGLSTLLNPVKFYESIFHSMSVNIYQICQGDKDNICEGRIRLELYLNMVSEFDLRFRSLDWSIKQIFDREIGNKCAIADSSTIIFERDRKSVSINEPSDIIEFGGRVFLLYDISALSKTFPFNLAAVYKRKLDLSRKRPETLMSIYSFLGGSNQQSGRVVSVIKNDQSFKQDVIYTHIIPWFMRVYFHTIRLNCFSIDQENVKKDGYIREHHFIPGKDRIRPFFIEYGLVLPSLSFCEFSFEFDKAFLRVSEYPPDANRGRYVPAASLSFMASDELWYTNITVHGDFLISALDEINGTQSSRCITIYGNALLVLLPVPDFSMPFNVICLVCTAIVMLFGPVHSLTTKIMIPLSRKDKDLAPVPPLRKLLLSIYKNSEIRLKRFVKREPKAAEMVVCAGSATGSFAENISESIGDKNSPFLKERRKTKSVANDTQ